MDLKDRTEEIRSLRSTIEGKSETAARKRIALLFDEGTFVEIGAFVKQRPTELGAVDAAAEGVVTGYGAVNGVLVFAFSQDISVLKGAVSEMNAEKICNIAEMARKAHAPLVCMLDSCGVRLQEGIDALAGYGKILATLNSIADETVIVSSVFGTCAGALSFIPAMADYSVMTENAELFLSSPDVVKARFGSSNAGTAQNAYENGTVSAVCTSDEEAVEKIKEFIAFTCDAYVTEDDINRLTPEIADIISVEGYDVHNVITAIADDGKVLELNPGYAKNIVTILIDIDCSPVGVVANNGALSADAAEKASAFITFCNNSSIPVLTLVDTDGFVCDGKENILNSSLLVSAYMNADVPKVTLIIGKAYGAGYISMCSKQTGADIVYAYPCAEIAALPAETGAVFMCAQEIIQTEGDPIEGRNEVIEKYRHTIASPLEAAKRGHVDDIIDIETTRQLIASSFGMLADK
jgi:acetyl-CoA carboxylase carboxyltransferase component